MQREQTESIVLSRRDYGEADRIVAFLSPKFGKISCLVKGARKPKSKICFEAKAMRASNGLLLIENANITIDAIKNSTSPMSPMSVSVARNLLSISKFILLYINPSGFGNIFESVAFEKLYES
jgi:hypothetical protein